MTSIYPDIPLIFLFPSPEDTFEKTEKYSQTLKIDSSYFYKVGKDFPLNLFFNEKQETIIFPSTFIFLDQEIILKSFGSGTSFYKDVHEILSRYQ